MAGKWNQMLKHLRGDISTGRYGKGAQKADNMQDEVKRIKGEVKPPKGEVDPEDHIIDADFVDEMATPPVPGVVKSRLKKGAAVGSGVGAGLFMAGTADAPEAIKPKDKEEPAKSEEIADESREETPTPSKVPAASAFDSISTALTGSSMGDFSPPGTSDEERKKIESKMEGLKLDKGYLSAVNKANEEFNSKYDEALSAYVNERDSIKRKQMWEGIVQGFIQMAAGLYGLRAGVGVGNLQLKPTDWNAWVKEASGEFDKAIKGAGAKRTGKVGEADAEVKLGEMRRSRLTDKLKRLAESDANTYNRYAKQFDANLNKKGMELEQEAKEAGLALRKAEGESREEYQRGQLGLAKDKAAAKMGSKGDPGKFSDARKARNKALTDMTNAFGAVDKDGDPVDIRNSVRKVRGHAAQAGIYLTDKDLNPGSWSSDEDKQEISELMQKVKMISDELAPGEVMARDPKTGQWGKVEGATPIQLYDAGYTVVEGR